METKESEELRALNHLAREIFDIKFYSDLTSEQRLAIDEELIFRDKMGWRS